MFVNLKVTGGLKLPRYPVHAIHSLHSDMQAVKCKNTFNWSVMCLYVLYWLHGSEANDCVYIFFLCLEFPPAATSAEKVNCTPQKVGSRLRLFDIHFQHDASAEKKKTAAPWDQSWGYLTSTCQPHFHYWLLQWTPKHPTTLVWLGSSSSFPLLPPSVLLWTRGCPVDYGATITTVLVDAVLLPIFKTVPVASVDMVSILETFPAALVGAVPLPETIPAALVDTVSITETLPTVD